MGIDQSACVHAKLFDNEDELEKAVVVYRLLPKDVSVEVFSLLPVDDQLRIVEGINPMTEFIVDGKK